MCPFFGALYSRDIPFWASACSNKLTATTNKTAIIQQVVFVVLRILIVNPFEVGGQSSNPFIAWLAPPSATIPLLILVACCRPAHGHRISEQRVQLNHFEWATLPHKSNPHYPEIIISSFRFVFRETCTLPQITFLLSCTHHCPTKETWHHYCCFLAHSHTAPWSLPISVPLSGSGRFYTALKNRENALPTPHKSNADPPPGIPPTGHRSHTKATTIVCPARAILVSVFFGCPTSCCCCCRRKAVGCENC